MTTPAWLTLVLAVLSPVGIIVGVALTQFFGNRREDLRWGREREREQQVWAREDAARSFEHRREAYITFFAEYHNMWTACVEWGQCGGYPGDPPEDTLVPLFMNLAELKIYGTATAYKLANAAFEALSRYVSEGTELPLTALDEFQAQVRRGSSGPRRHRITGTTPQPCPARGRWGGRVLTTSPEGYHAAPRAQALQESILAFDRGARVTRQT